MSETRTINLDRLRDGVGTYSPEKCAAALQAAVICLEKTCHSSGVTCRLESSNQIQKLIEICWSEEVDDNDRGSWEDEFELVEWGAIAIALTIIGEYTDYDLVRQAKRGKGEDFFLGYTGSSNPQPGFPAYKARLEVSGILRATADNTVAKRVKQKLARASQYDGNSKQLHIIVTEFGEPMVEWNEEARSNGH